MTFEQYVCGLSRIGWVILFVALMGFAALGVIILNGS